MFRTARRLQRYASPSGRVRGEAHRQRSGDAMRAIGRHFGFIILGLTALAMLGRSDRAAAAVIEYGTENVLNTGATYPSDPKAGATLEGLAPNVITDATLTLNHGFPFTPAAGNFPGTDQI